MGDVLHAMPAVAALRERHPEWTIGWAIEPGWSELLQSSEELRRSGVSGGRSAGKPLVDVWHPVPTKSWKQHPFAPMTLFSIGALRRELRSCEYDVCVDMQGAIRSAVVGRMAGAGLFAGPAKPRETQARWLYEERVSTSATHVVEQGCELLSGVLAETLQAVKVPLPFEEATEAWCDQWLAPRVGRGERFAFIVPGAGWGAKQWPAERYGAVAAALGRRGYRTVVNGSGSASGSASGPGRSVDEVVAKSEGFATSVPCSIGQLIALVRRAGVVIAGDTGPLHLAAALERPLVGLFGPTDPARNGPFVGEDSKAMSIVLRHGPERRDHSRRSEPEPGLLEITVGEVVEAALKLLESEHGKVKG